MKDERGVGLCADCAHAQVVESSRGNRFYRCRLSESDARFARYPRLPVLACEGHERAGADGQRAVTES